MRSRIGRGLSAGLVVGLCALGVASCGDDDEGGGGTESGTTTDGNGGDDSVEVLTIGFVYPDLSEFAAVNPAYDTGDNEEQALAMVDAWRAEGLLPEGVDVELVMRSFNPTDDTTKVAVCQQLAEEDQVFAAIVHRTAATAAECLAERFDVPTVSADPSPTSLYEQAPHLFTIRSDESTVSKNFVAWADEEGLLEGETLGLFHDTASAESVDALRAELSERGYEIASEVETGGQGVGSEQDQLAVQRFQADGVTAVIPMIGGTTLTNFMTFAEQQGYEPTYLDFDFSEHMVDAAAAGRPASQTGGVVSISQNRIGDFSDEGEVSEEAQQCLDDYESYGGEALDAVAPESAELNNIMITCSLGAVLRTGIQNAADAGDLTQDGLVAGLEAISGMSTANWDSVTFSAEDHSGADTFRPVSFSSECECFQPAGDYQKFLVD